MLICFSLSMPSNNSWNGKWSGQDNIYAVVRSVTKKTAKKLLNIECATYNFGDGWRAAIDITHVTAKEANKIRKQSEGFCGYDWMITSLITKGEIVS